MKKLFAAILALGLIVAFSAPASAADIKLGGSYYLVGVYDSNPTLREDSFSTAYYWQRIRLEPVFKIAEGLEFVARMDAMEKQWGNTNWKATPGDDTTLSRRQASGNQKIQESFEWERGYAQFMTGIGQFQIGYQTAGAYGLTFGDNTASRPRIRLNTKVGPLSVTVLTEKNSEANTTGLTDADVNSYALSLVYPFKGGAVGMLNVYKTVANNRATANNKGTLWVGVPFVKATFGPVYFEAEIDHIGGTVAKFEAPSTAQDKDADSWAAYAMAKTTMGPATVGALVAWAKGDNDPNDDKVENMSGGGADWNPALILMNDDMSTWSAGGNVFGGYANTSNSGKNNFLMFNAFGSYAVTPKIKLDGAFTYAKADKVAAGWDKDMGYEFDLTATYKLYDNLSYMVGAGYLFAGDYYKGGNANAKVDDDYILMNKLTLNF